MKTLLLINLILVLFGNISFGQPPCAINVKIQSPAVSRATEFQSSFNSNCDVVTISWPSNTNQSYVVTSTYTDEASGKTTSAESILPITDKSSCSIQLPFKSGTTLSWTIQSVQVIDGRTFYSYPLRGEISGCKQDLIVEAGKSANPKSAMSDVNKGSLNNGLTVYPNPVTGELVFTWKSEYKGNAQLSIMNASGKAIKTMSIRKEQLSYSDRLTVNTLSAGLYFIHINMLNGKSLSTRFIKK